jgi:glutaminyl-peptide cyclotransferase
MRSPRFRRSRRRRASSARASKRRRATPPIGAGLAALALLVAAGCDDDDDSSSSANRFDGADATSLIRAQVAVGQRPAGSAKLRNLAVTLRDTLGAEPGAGIRARFEPFPSTGPQQGLRNIVGVLPGRVPAILIGAHYDTEWHPRGFVGANDGAAGTAAVIELARSLPADLPENHREIRFVLFDGEEEPPGCADQDFQFCALRGSRAYAAAHPGEIGDMILLDYVANRDARIRREANSNQALWEQLRQAAGEVGAAGIFPPGVQGGVIDDHIPLLEQGVPSIDLIDFNYPYADTVEDTVDKLDPAILDNIGETVAQLVIDLNRGD